MDLPKKLYYSFNEIRKFTCWVEFKDKLLLQNIIHHNSQSGKGYHIATFFIFASQTCIDFRAKFSKNYKGGVQGLHKS